MRPPPCESCKPHLSAEQEDVAIIYNLVSSQVIVSFGGVVDLDYKTLDFIFNLYDVKNKRKYFELIRIMFHTYLKEKPDDEDKQ